MSWIPLMEYAVKKGISLSTLRRHIKAEKIPYRLENGRYLLLDLDSGVGEYLAISSERVSVPSPSLVNDLMKAKEEIAELKTLIAFYEEKMLHSGPNG